MKQLSDIACILSNITDDIDEKAVWRVQPVTGRHSNKAKKHLAGGSYCKVLEIDVKRKGLTQYLEKEGFRSPKPSAEKGRKSKRGARDMESVI